MSSGEALGFGVFFLACAGGLVGAYQATGHFDSESVDIDSAVAAETNGVEQQEETRPPFDLGNVGEAVEGLNQQLDKGNETPLVLPLTLPGLGQPGP